LWLVFGGTLRRLFALARHLAHTSLRFGSHCSVLRGLVANNPDVDKEILVQLHNVACIVHRRYALAPH
jgi:hypothetical protein